MSSGGGSVVAGAAATGAGFAAVELGGSTAAGAELAGTGRVVGCTASGVAAGDGRAVTVTGEAVTVTGTGTVTVAGRFPAASPLHPPNTAVAASRPAATRHPFVVMQRRVVAGAATVR